MKYFLGYDIGSSSIKAALVNADNGRTIGQSRYPLQEMTISSPSLGWAEQNPEDWWKYLIIATNELISTSKIAPHEICAIGISYQMHGLILVDKDQNVLRPAIIWCDSRSAEIGDQAFLHIGKEKCLTALLNSPGNFTATKLKWVKEKEPALFDRIHKVMLPGDFIAMKLTGDISTTICGLSEGTLWNFQTNSISSEILSTYGFEENLFPPVCPVFGEQGKLSLKAATELGLKPGTQVSYRSGDQPNNAMSLNANKPGDFAANGGTSGVIYGVTDKLVSDKHNRVNSFAHVNHTKENPKIGILLCIDGTGIQFRWVMQQIANDGNSYEEMEKEAAQIPINSDDLRILPFGNGAERMLNNRQIGSHMLNIQFNRHSRSHIFRASLEGIAFSFMYGIKIFDDLGLRIGSLRVGNDNLFQSNIFSTTLVSLTGVPIEIMEINGAAGAAKGAGIGIGYYSNFDEAFGKQRVLKTYLPEKNNEIYLKGYEAWKNDLEKFINGTN